MRKSSPEAELETAETRRLSALDAHYRGTVAGAFDLRNLYRLSFPKEGELETPEGKRQVDLYRPIYNEIATDLVKFDHMTALASNAEPADSARTDSTQPIAKMRASSFQADPLNHWRSIVSRIQENHDGFHTVVAAIRADSSGDRTGLIESMRQFLEKRDRSAASLRGEKAETQAPSGDISLVSER